MFPVGYFAAAYFDEAYFSPDGASVVFAYGGLLLLLGVE
jgi:hypothetical protein